MGKRDRGRGKNGQHFQVIPQDLVVLKGSYTNTSDRTRPNQHVPSIFSNIVKSYLIYFPTTTTHSMCVCTLIPLWVNHVNPVKVKASGPEASLKLMIKERASKIINHGYQPRKDKKRVNCTDINLERTKKRVNCTDDFLTQHLVHQQYLFYIYFLFFFSFLEQKKL